MIVASLPAAARSSSTARRSTAGQIHRRPATSRRPAELHAGRPTNGAARSSRFQVQDDGGTANSGVDTEQHAAPSRSRDHTSRRSTTLRRRRQDGHHHRKTRPTRSSGRLRLHRSERQPGQQPAGREDHDAAAPAACCSTTASRSPPARSSRSATSYAATCDVRPGGQRHGSRYASFTLPGAGQRRHGQRRRRSRSERQHDDVNVTPVNDAPAGTDRRSRRWKTRPTRSAAADFRFSDPNDIPANTLLRSRSRRCRPPAR